MHDLRDAPPAVAARPARWDRQFLLVVAGTVTLEVLFYDDGWLSNDWLLLAVLVVGPALVAFAATRATDVARYRGAGTVAAITAGLTAGLVEFADHAPWTYTDQWAGDVLVAALLAGGLATSGMFGITVWLTRRTRRPFGRVVIGSAVLVLAASGVAWATHEGTGDLLLLAAGPTAALVAGVLVGRWQAVAGAGLGSAVFAAIFGGENLLNPPPVTVERSTNPEVVVILLVGFMAPAIVASTLGVAIRGR